MSLRVAAAVMALSVPAALVVGLAASDARAEPAPVADETPSYPPTFPIAISVATKDGAAAASDPWITAQIDAANELFEPIGVRFRWTLRKEIGAAHFEMHSRADRDVLGTLVESNVIDVFVVSALEDVDEPGRMRKGVAWTTRAGPAPGRRFVILSAAAPRGVLTHELGHFFGNGHTDAPDNLMSYTRTGATVFLDDAQIARTREFSLRFLASGRLPDVGPARRLP